MVSKVITCITVNNTVTYDMLTVVEQERFLRCDLFIITEYRGIDSGFPLHESTSPKWDIDTVVHMLNPTSLKNYELED